VRVAGDKPSRGWLGERAVAFWTVAGGATAILALTITVTSTSHSEPTVVSGPTAPQGSVSASPNSTIEVVPTPTTQSAPPSTTTTPSVALADEALTWVADMESLTYENSISINGKQFADTFTYTYSDCTTWCANASVDFTLGRRYRQFTARLGVVDSSKGQGAILMRIIGDGKTLLTQSVSLGKSVDVHISVEGILRLRILASATYGAPGGTVSIGDPMADG